MKTTLYGHLASALLVLALIPAPAQADGLALRTRRCS